MKPGNLVVPESRYTHMYTYAHVHTYTFKEVQLKGHRSQLNKSNNKTKAFLDYNLNRIFMSPDDK